MECGYHRDLQKKFLQVELIRDELFSQIFQPRGSISANGLFHHVVKDLFDKPRLRLVAADGEFGHILSALEPDGLAFVIKKIADDVYWFIIVPRPETSHRIVVFQAEPEGINYRMTTLAGLGTGQFRNLFAHGQVGSEIRVFEGDGHRRRSQRAPRSEE